jgi:hypothetical protein
MRLFELWVDDRQASPLRRWWSSGGVRILHGNREAGRNDRKNNKKKNEKSEPSIMREQ